MLPLGMRVTRIWAENINYLAPDVDKLELESVKIPALVYLPNRGCNPDSGFPNGVVQQDQFHTYLLPRYGKWSHVRNIGCHHFLVLPAEEPYFLV